MPRHPTARRGVLPHVRLRGAPSATGPTQRLASPPSATPLRDRMVPAPPQTSQGYGNIRQGICPRCQADAIYTDGAWKPYRPDQLWISPKVLTRITHFVCQSCGYIESYVLDETARAELERYWLRLEPNLLSAAQIETEVRKLVRLGLIGSAVSYAQKQLGMSVERAEEYVRSFQ